MTTSLLRGDLIVMPPEREPHAYYNTEAADYLRTLLGERVKIRDAKPITLPNDSEPAPDVAIVSQVNKFSCTVRVWDGEYTIGLQHLKSFNYLPAECQQVREISDACGGLRLRLFFFLDKENGHSNKNGRRKWTQIQETKEENSTPINITPRQLFFFAIFWTFLEGKVGQPVQNLIQVT